MSYSVFKEAPPVIWEFLNYLSNIQGRSDLTVDEYYRDLRTFFRFIIKDRGLSDTDTEIDDIDISCVDVRKTSVLRDFYKYLTVKVHKINHNPTEELETPRKGKKLPKYLTLEESLRLLEAVDGEFKERDYCILIFFLNCGLRLSELVGINLSDFNSDYILTVRGKGNKERMIPLNPACVNALKKYLEVRNATDSTKDKNALFISRKNCRMTGKGVYHMVNHYLTKIGLGNQGYSPHKLRHTAATLMYQKGGVDIRTLQAILGHSNLGTTQIYTHIADEQIEKAVNANPLAKL